MTSLSPNFARSAVINCSASSCVVQYQICTNPCVTFGCGMFITCSGLQLKRAGTAINGNLGPDYLHLSIPSRRDSVQRRLQSVARDCNQGDQDHVTCNYPGSPSSTCLYAREGACVSGERLGGAAISFTFRPGSRSVSPRVSPPC